MVVRAVPLADSSTDVPAGSSWPGRMRHVATFGLGGDAAVVALAGFLVRGGIALLALPGVVLPSIIGVAGAVGISSFAIDGSPTARLFMIVTVAIGAALVWLAVAGFVGSLVDVWLIEAAVDRELPAGRRRTMPEAGLVMDLVAIRGITLLPLTAALAWAGTRVYSAAYAELITPSNLVVPIFVRVIESAADAVVVIVAAWLVTETIAALAVRRMVLAGDGAWTAIVGALLHVARRPVSTVLTLVTWTSVSVLATAAAMAATATAFGWCLFAARIADPIAMTLGVGPLATTRDFRPVVFGLAALVVTAAWLAGAAISGIASAWRSAAWTSEVADSLSRRSAGHDAAGAPAEFPAPATTED